MSDEKHQELIFNLQKITEKEMRWTLENWIEGWKIEFTEPSFEMEDDYFVFVSPCILTLDDIKLDVDEIRGYCKLQVGYESDDEEWFISNTGVRFCYDGENFEDFEEIYTWLFSTIAYKYKQLNKRIVYLLKQCNEYVENERTSSKSNC